MDNGWLVAASKAGILNRQFRLKQPGVEVRISGRYVDISKWGLFPRKTHSHIYWCIFRFRAKGWTSHLFKSDSCGTERGYNITLCKVSEAQGEDKYIFIFWSRSRAWSKEMPTPISPYPLRKSCQRKSRTITYVWTYTYPLFWSCTEAIHRAKGKFLIYKNDCAKITFKKRQLGKAASPSKTDSWPLEGNGLTLKK